jgi:hypothetical protein
LETLHKIVTLFVILLGVVHLGLTPLFFNELTTYVMWYVAQGLLAVVIGFLNLATARAAWRDPFTARLCHGANGLGLVFIALYSIVDASPPSMVAMVLFVLLFLSALALHRRNAEP